MSQADAAINAVRSEREMKWDGCRERVEVRKDRGLLLYLQCDYSVTNETFSGKERDNGAAEKGAFSGLADRTGIGQAAPLAFSALVHNG